MDIRWRATVFQAEQGRRDIAQTGQIRLGVAAFFEQKIADLRLPGAQLRRQIGVDQVGQAGLRGPGIAAIVEDDGQDRRQRFARANGTGLAQVFIEQAHIGEQTHGHVRIDAGLEFQQQIDIEPVFAPFLDQAQTPEDIVLAFAQVVANADLAHSFQGVEIQRLRPILVDEAANQVGDQLAVREQQFVGGVVFGHEVWGAAIQYTRSFGGKDSTVSGLVRTGL